MVVEKYLADDGTEQTIPAHARPVFEAQKTAGKILRGETRLPTTIPGPVLREARDGAFQPLVDAVQNDQASKRNLGIPRQGRNALTAG